MLLSHCCCCFSLRSGMLFLGWAQVVLSLVALSGVIIEDSSSSTSPFHQFLGSSFRTLYILLGGSVIQTIAAGCLLYGVYRRSSDYVLEYVKLEALLHFASLLEFALYLLLEHGSFSTQEIYVFLIFLGLNYGLAVYYIVAAYSYYHIMKDETDVPLLHS